MKDIRQFASKCASHAMDKLLLNEGPGATLEPPQEISPSGRFSLQPEAKVHRHFALLSNSNTPSSRAPSTPCRLRKAAGIQVFSERR